MHCLGICWCLVRVKLKLININSSKLCCEYVFHKTLVFLFFLSDSFHIMSERKRCHVSICFPDIPWWRHQMEAFSALLALCERNPPVTGGFSPTKASHAKLWCFLWSTPEKKPVEQANRYAGDLRRHRTHYDVTVTRMAEALVIIPQTVNLEAYSHNLYNIFKLYNSFNFHFNYPIKFWYAVLPSWHAQIYGLAGSVFYFRAHYSDVIVGAIASQITSLTIVYSTVYSDADQRKHQSSASLAFVRGIHRGPVNSPQKWPVTRKMFPFDDVIMNTSYLSTYG